MTQALTIRMIEAISNPAKKYEIPDGKVENLFLLIQITGKKSWVWRGRIKGKPQRITLGAYPLHSIEDAREWAKEISRKRDQGFDPAAEKAKEEAEIAEKAELDTRTCDWCFALYMEHEGGKKKSGHEKQRLYNKDIKPHIGDTSIFEIKHDALAKIIRNKDKNHPTTANHLVSLIKRWFRWSVTLGRDLTGLTDDPARDLVKLTPIGERDRHLSDYEIGVFFRAVHEDPSIFNEVLVYILYTGLRRTEAFELPWTELAELDTKSLMIIPGSRTKNGKDHLLSLPVEMVALLQARRRRTGNGIYVWPSDRTIARRDNPAKGIKAGDEVEVPMSKWSQRIAALNEACFKIALKDGKKWEPFTTHDLRRTLSSGMNALHDENDQPRIPSHIVERVINHTLGGVAAIYNRYDYLAEKKAALRVWADHLTEIRKSVKLPAFPVESDDAALAA